MTWEYRLSFATYTSTQRLAKHNVNTLNHYCSKAASKECNMQDQTPNYPCTAQARYMRKDQTAIFVNFSEGWKFLIYWQKRNHHFPPNNGSTNLPKIAREVLLHLVAVGLALHAGQKSVRVALHEISVSSRLLRISLRTPSSPSLRTVAATHLCHTFSATSFLGIQIQNCHCCCPEWAGHG